MSQETSSRRLYMRLQDHSYDVILRRGCIHSLHHFTDVINRPVFIVTDEGIPQTVVEAVMDQCSFAAVHLAPQGPAAKTLTAYGDLLRTMSLWLNDNSGVLIALGGGSVADLAGFAACTFQGGMDFINIPTTVAGQLDPCLSVGPNLDIFDVPGQPGPSLGVIKTSRQPDLVLLDPDLLATLPEQEFTQGFAEALRTALPLSAELFTLLEASDLHEAVDEILWRALTAKKPLLEARTPGSALEFGLPTARALRADKGPRGRRTKGMSYAESLTLGLLPCITDPDLLRRARAVCRRLGLPWRPVRMTDGLQYGLLRLIDSEGRVPLIQIPALGCWEQGSAAPEELFPIKGGSQ